MKALTYTDGSGWLILCPACGNGHKFDSHIWRFNGEVDKPSFWDSMLVRTEYVPGVPYVCHSYVEEGKIRFLGDSTHPLAGQTVDLEEWAPIYQQMLDADGG